MPLEALNLRRLNWDDTALVKAFDELKAERDRNKKNLIRDESGVSEWKVNSPCRAPYNGDNRYYEAEIHEINGKNCTVKFVGYDDEPVEVELALLKKSCGRTARAYQWADANDCMDDVKSLPCSSDSDNNLLMTKPSNGKKGDIKKIENASQWEVEDYCRAPFGHDNKYYEAQILRIEKRDCTVKFIGYEEDEPTEVDLLSLKKSKGPKMREYQWAKAHDWVDKLTMRNEARKNKGPALQWKVNSYCRAPCDADNKYYEAQIKRINGKTCTVMYFGYEEDEPTEVEMIFLKKSNGRRARVYQRADVHNYIDDLKSLEYSSDSDRAFSPMPKPNADQIQKTLKNYNHPNMMQNRYGDGTTSDDDTSLDFTRPKRSGAGKGSGRMKEMPVKEDISRHSHDFPYPDPSLLHGMPPPLGRSSLDGSLYSTLISWYIAGYQAGLYLGTKGKDKQSPRRRRHH